MFSFLRMILIDFLWGYTKSSNSKQCICEDETWTELKSWRMIFNMLCSSGTKQKITRYLNCCAKIQVENSFFLFLFYLSFGWHSWVQSERKLNLSLSKHKNDSTVCVHLCKRVHCASVQKTLNTIRSTRGARRRLKCSLVELKLKIECMSAYKIGINDFIQLLCLHSCLVFE